MVSPILVTLVDGLILTRVRNLFSLGIVTTHLQRLKRTNGELDDITIPPQKLHQNLSVDLIDGTAGNRVLVSRISELAVNKE